MAMLELFTFLDNPYLIILEESLMSLPGIERVDLLFFNKDSGKLELHCIERKKNNQKSEQLNIKSDSIDTLNSFRRHQNIENWLNISTIPYSKTNSNTLSQDLFSEFDSHVLTLGFSNETDYSKDLFLFYFRKNTADFGLSLSDKVLSTSNKAIIGHLLYHTIQSRLNTIKHNQKSLKILNEQTRNLLNNKKVTEQSLIQLKTRNKENLLQLSEFLINSIDKSKNDVYYLAEDAKEKIGEFTGSIENLKSILSKAMSLAKTLNFGNAVHEHLLIADYFHFNTIAPSHEIANAAPILSEENSKHKHSKTFDFLNDMEIASQKVLKLNWKLTSANVGSKLERPITAAAISDKLKNHSQKIIRLLEQYPAKWPLIRKRFKPLQNIVIKAENTNFVKAS